MYCSVLSHTCVTLVVSQYSLVFYIFNFVFCGSFLHSYNLLSFGGQNVKSSKAYSLLEA